MSDPEIEVLDLPAGKVARIRGEMRLRLEPIERQLNRLAAGRPSLVVLDLSGVTLMSSLAMGLLVAFRRGVVGHGGRVRIAGATPLVHDSLNRVRLGELFEFFPSVDAAMAP